MFDFLKPKKTLTELEVLLIGTFASFQFKHIENKIRFNTATQIETALHQCRESATRMVGVRPDENSNSAIHALITTIALDQSPFTMRLLKKWEAGDRTLNFLTPDDTQKIWEMTKLNLAEFCAVLSKKCDRRKNVWTVWKKGCHKFII